MMSTTRLPLHAIQEIRETVNRHMVELGAKREEVNELHESVLRDGKYEIAIRFRAGRLIAVWNCPHGSLHFYDDCGSKLRTIKAC